MDRYGAPTTTIVRIRRYKKNKEGKTINNPITHYGKYCTQCEAIIGSDRNGRRKKQKK